MSSMTISAKADEIRRQVIELCRTHKIRHLASSLSCVDVLVELFYNVLQNDDVFVLSKGHASPTLYCIMRDLHPESVEGVDPRTAAHLPKGNVSIITCGSLGHGIGIGAGIALTKPNINVYVLTGDAELCEGSCWEAATFALAHGLSNLFVIVDNNSVGATGRITDFGLDCIPGRFIMFGWKNMGSLNESTYPSGRPHVYVAHTVKGRGIHALETDPVGCHGRLE